MADKKHTYTVETDIGPIEIKSDEKLSPAELEEQVQTKLTRLGFSNAAARRRKAQAPA